MTSGITTHTVVKNEDRFIWYVVMAVIDHVDKMIIYDTGSQDHTYEILKSIDNPKIHLEQHPITDPDQVTALRQKQLELTTTDWFLILDGDEVWWGDAISQVITTTKKADKNLWGIITPTVNCIGDIYHYQDARAGKYTFAGRTGHLAVRAIRRNIPGLYIKDTYPLEGYFDRSDKLVTDYDEKLRFQDKGYLHLTNLSRSTLHKDTAISREKKYEIGHRFSSDFEYPEVFSLSRPALVPDPFIAMDTLTKIRSMIETPLKKIKRKLSS